MPDMTNENVNQQKKSPFQRRAWVYIMLMVNIAFILVLLTIGIVALRVNNSLPENMDIVFIVGKEPEVITDDGKNAWTTGREADIFRASYVNGEGNTTVASSDGTSVIAPGTETTYKFSMYNNGNMAVVYATDLDFTLKIGDEVVSSREFPLLVRLKNASGKYIIGSESEWVGVSDAILDQYNSVLGASSYETFELELLWQFDGGNDELDTLYGDLAAERGVTLIMGINTYAIEHEDPTAAGGMAIDSSKPTNQEYGGTIRWLWLILLILNTAVIIFYISWLMNKRLHDLDKN